MPYSPSPSRYWPSTSSFPKTSREAEVKAKAGGAAAAPKPPKPEDDKPKTQVWVLDMVLGGEPRQLTKQDEGVSELSWSPDGAGLERARRRA